MCGICGIVSTDPSEHFDLRIIQRMRDTLAHRGPDDKGAYLGPGVALGPSSAVHHRSSARRASTHVQ